MRTPRQRPLPEPIRTDPTTAQPVRQASPSAAPAAALLASSPKSAAQRRQIQAAFGPATGRAPQTTSQPATPVLQATIDKDFRTRVNDLASLNTALALLNPPVAALTLAGVGVAGASAAMLDQVIAANHDTLYDSITQADVIAFYSGPLDTVVDTQAPTFAYDPHGDKHFPGGAAGTKFTAAKAAVNPQLETLVGAEIGRIRRDAAGAKTNYYYTLAGIAECGGKDLVIQINFDPATDTVDYHGYPDDNVQAYSLSRAKGGAAIP